MASNYKNISENISTIMEGVKTQMDQYAKQLIDKALEESLQDVVDFEDIVNNNGINLRESIKNIVSSEARSNKKLMETLEQYANALNQGLYEERLYEGFVHNISKFDYLLPVETEINRINEAVKENASSIEVAKILEEMNESDSFYILPLIKEDACRFVKFPTDINRAQLRNALAPFAADRFCYAMLESIERNATAILETADSQAISFKDKVKMIRENANVSAIYSPVQYIKENECVFNANGQFYVKKGNTLAKLSEEYLPQLSDRFVSLCKLVNDERVSINEDNIVFVGRDKIATIYENYIDINGHKETIESVRSLEEMAMKYDFDTNFFITVANLYENFDNIAQINFGKHIALNEDEGVNIDMFRLGNNIFVNTVNENLLKSTFYHNVNPIQCRNLINKHMGLNVASLFEDLIPSQEKLLMKLNETKSEYEVAIEKYDAMLDKLNDALTNCTSEDNEKKLKETIKSTEEKLKEIKAEYKEWQKNADNATNAKSEEEKQEDANTEVEKSNEPATEEEVEQNMEELTTPLEDKNEVEPVDSVSDEDFDSYLEGGNEVENAEETEEPKSEEDILPAADPEVEGDVEEEPVEDAFTEVNIEEPAAEEPEELMFDEPNAEVDEEPVEVEEPVAVEEVAVPEGYKIANISFDKNVKTGELFRTGTVIVIAPMVDGNGRMYVQSNNYNFYIDEATHLPVLDAENIPVALYNAIVASIQVEPDFVNADAAGIAEEALAEPKADEVWYSKEDVDKVSNEIEANDENEFFDIVDDEAALVISPKEEAPAEEPAVVAEVPAEEPVVEEPTVELIFNDYHENPENSVVDVQPEAEPVVAAPAIAEEPIAEPDVAEVPAEEVQAPEVAVAAEVEPKSDIIEITAEKAPAEEEEEEINFDLDEEPSDIIVTEAEVEECATVMNESIDYAALAMAKLEKELA